MFEPAVLAQILWTGLATSSHMVLFTIAFALVLKVVKLWNFAQAGMMAIAFYAMYAGVNQFGWPTLPSVGFGLALTLAATLALERFGFRVLRARRSSSLLFFIFTLVCSEFAAYALTLIFGTEPAPLFERILSPVRIVAGIAVSDWDLLALGVTIGLATALALYLRFSSDGRCLVAVSDNAELAELYGISAKRAYLIAFALASVLVCAGMYLYGTRTAVIPTAPLQLMIFAVIATLLGGMGSVLGAAIAAVTLSLLQSYSILIVPSKWQGMILYVFLFVTILFFPSGAHPMRLLRRFGLRRG
ncbi:MAG: branched-chain amino acid ABC transporter permease [Betaproteobacteria bacterium]|nr:branched-chain amino acid ABC transporter permease [Betaproteobacteria bacterium]